MSTHDFPMTIKGKLMLEEELAQLVKVDRENIKTAIAEAREHGDLKENAEYHAAKEKQSMIEGKILELQNKLSRVQVVDITQIKTDKIVFGATVKLYEEERDRRIVYQLVGEDEAKTDPTKISYNSPIAKALIGKEVGDEVIVKAPKGDITYEVEDVIYK